MGPDPFARLFDQARFFDNKKTHNKPPQAERAPISDKVVIFAKHNPFPFLASPLPGEGAKWNTIKIERMQQSPNMRKPTAFKQRFLAIFGPIAAAAIGQSAMSAMTTSNPRVVILQGLDAPDPLLPGGQGLGDHSLLDSASTMVVAHDSQREVLEKHRQDENGKWNLELVNSCGPLTEADVKRVVDNVVSLDPNPVHDKAILLYTGHGGLSETGKWSFTWGPDANSAQPLPAGHFAVWAKGLLKHYKDVMIIISSCYSGTAAAEVTKELHGDTLARTTVVSGSCKLQRMTSSDARAAPFEALLRRSAVIDLYFAGVVSGDMGFKDRIQELAKPPQSRISPLREVEELCVFDWYLKARTSRLQKAAKVQKIKLAPGEQPPLCTCTSCMAVPGPGDLQALGEQGASFEEYADFGSRDLLQVAERTCQKFHLVHRGLGSLSLAQWGLGVKEMLVTAVLRQRQAQALKSNREFLRELGIPEEWEPFLIDIRVADGVWKSIWHDASFDTLYIPGELTSWPTRYRRFVLRFDVGAAGLARDQERVMVTRKAIQNDKTRNRHKSVKESIKNFQKHFGNAPQGTQDQDRVLVSREAIQNTKTRKRHRSVKEMVENHKKYFGHKMRHRREANGGKVVVKGV